MSHFPFIHVVSFILSVYLNIYQSDFDELKLRNEFQTNKTVLSLIGLQYNVFYIKQTRESTRDESIAAVDA